MLKLKQFCSILYNILELPPSAAQDPLTPTPPIKVLPHGLVFPIQPDTHIKPEFTVTTSKPAAQTVVTPNQLNLDLGLDPPTSQMDVVSNSQSSDMDFMDVDMMELLDTVIPHTTVNSRTTPPYKETSDPLLSHTHDPFDLLSVDEMDLKLPADSISMWD